ncbi:JMJD8 [Branchiostoma lanceolatum]|uniref:JMJD8 protein n=1 Tax=Branchiostoma lanceolatum TaxID=7740 RepID=A0A8K0EI33_BRALA|nr:JMJD8 [Branchiostoma lanceolatum]
MARKRKNLHGKSASPNQPAAGRKSGVTWDDHAGNKARSLDETDGLEDRRTSRSQSWPSSPERSLKGSGESSAVLQDLKTDEVLHKNVNFNGKNGFRMSLFVLFIFGAVMVSRHEEGNTGVNLWNFWDFNTTSAEHVKTTTRDTTFNVNHVDLRPSKVPKDSVKVSSEENASSCEPGSHSATKNGPILSDTNVLQDGAANLSNVTQDEPANLTDTFQDGLTYSTDTLQYGPANISSILQDENVNLTLPFQDDSDSQAAPFQDKDSNSSAIQDVRGNLTNSSQDGDKNAADEEPNLLAPSPDEPLSLETILNLQDKGYPLPPDLEDDVQSQGTRINLSAAPPNDGGWRTDEDDVMMYAIRRCDFDVRYADQMTSEEFESTYRNRKPVLLRFRGGARDWTNPDVWTRGSLVSRYGDRQVQTGYPQDIIVNNGQGDDSERLSAYLTHYLDDTSCKFEFDSKYVTDRGAIMTELLPHIRLPPYLNQSRLGEPVHRLFLGGSGTGSAWHLHAQAWNGVVFGAKRWFIYAPDQRPPGIANFDQLDWMKYVHPYLRASGRPLECLQQAGDVVYIPQNFFHAVLNIGDTVAMSFADRDPLKSDSSAEEVSSFLQYVKLVGEGAVAAEMRHKLNARLEQILRKLKASPWGIPLMHEVHGSYELLRQRPRGAMALFQASITADPFRLSAYTLLAHAHVALEQHDKAEGAYLSALHLHRTSHSVWLEYGRFLEQRGNLTAAEQAYKKALIVRPRWAWLYQLLARVQAKLGKKKDLKITKDIYWYLKRTT